MIRELQQPQPIAPQKPLIDMIARAKLMEMYASDNEVTKRDVYFPWRSTHARPRHSRRVYIRLRSMNNDFARSGKHIMSNFRYFEFVCNCMVWGHGE